MGMGIVSESSQNALALASLDFCQSLDAIDQKHSLGCLATAPYSSKSAQIIAQMHSEMMTVQILE